MKQQFAVTHRYTILQEAGTLDRSLIQQHLSMLRFYENIRGFCVSVCVCVCVREHTIQTECVFATQLSGNAGISVSRTVWVTTNCCFLTDKNAATPTDGLSTDSPTHPTGYFPSPRLLPIPPSVTRCSNDTDKRQLYDASKVGT
jgi:hypothetical protein